jgi:hypothetical protein
MTFRIDVNVNVKEFGPIVRESVKAMAKNIRTKGRQDIARGGRFGNRFTRGLATGIRAVEGGYRVRVTLKPSFMKVFEYGGVSVGKPLLWIAPRGTPAYGIRAAAWGNLIRPRTKGFLGLGRRYRDVLIDKRTGAVRYVGVRYIRNVQRFHIRDISYAEAENFLRTMGQVSGLTTG